MQSGGAPAPLDLDGSIIVALGGNLDRHGQGVVQTFRSALAELEKERVAVERCSSIWRSAAWPDESEPAFLNAVAMVTTPLDPLSLLATLHRLEAQFGRARAAANAPRTLDLDLIAYGRQVAEGALSLPHPRAAERLFVMGPLAEIAPEWRHPVSGLTARALAASAAIGRDATPL